jgi:hypothetical protein
MPPTPPSSPAPASAPKSTTLAIISMAVGVVALVFAVIPPVVGFTFVVAITAIVLGIIALATHRPGKPFAIVGIVVGAVAWLVSIIVFFVTIANGISEIASSDFEPLPAVPEITSAPLTPTSIATPPPVAKPGVGATVTTRENLAVTLNSSTCGIAHAGDQYLGQNAKGQFCELTFTFVNGGDKQVSISDLDFTGKIGSASYEVTSGVSDYDGSFINADINPGITSHAKIYIDIPAGATLDSVTFRRTISIDSSVEFALK